MISQEAIEKILGLDNRVDVSAEEMCRKLTFTFYPFDASKCSKHSLRFKELLITALKELGIKVVPYESTLVKVPIYKVLKRFTKIVLNNILFVFNELLGLQHPYYMIHVGAIANLLKRTRVGKDIVIVAIGENRKGNLPIDYTSSFTRNPVITVLDCPKEIDGQSVFSRHFDEAMRIFSFHMTQIAILVSQKSFIVYNFNASHPIYPFDSNFRQNILKALIPKVAAPIRPPQLKDFVLEPESFNINDEKYELLLRDMVDGARIFDKTKLYPAGKKVDSLPFRSGFYKWIGKIHLDHRSGMSYGFLAKQLPSEPVKLELLSVVQKREGHPIVNKDFYLFKDELYVTLPIGGKLYSLKVPPVWVMSQRSGSDKTNINPHKDIILLGLVNGRMFLRTPVGTKLVRDYKPSFDTRVILAHAVGNSIVSSMLTHVRGGDNVFSSRLHTQGMGMIHWHGYLQKNIEPIGWHVHGRANPHVACSTPQSAIYALRGKLAVFDSVILKGGDYFGDIHIEPHHGSNVNYFSLTDFANLLLETPNASELGNKYLVLD